MPNQKSGPRFVRRLARLLLAAAVLAVLMITFTAPLVARFALRFGAPEFFAFSIMNFVIWRSCAGLPPDCCSATARPRPRAATGTAPAACASW